MVEQISMMLSCERGTNDALGVPLSCFVEKPIQTWTRTTRDLLGTVSVYAYDTLPVDELRSGLHRILLSSGMSDEKVLGQSRRQ